MFPAPLLFRARSGDHDVSLGERSRRVFGIPTDPHTDSHLKTRGGGA